MINDRRFTERFRAALKESGIKQVELSRRTGIPVDSIGSYYRGGSSPGTEERRQKLALALGKPKDYFSMPRKKKPCRSSAGKEHWRWDGELF